MLLFLPVASAGELYPKCLLLPRDRPRAARFFLLVGWSWQEPRQTPALKGPAGVECGARSALKGPPGVEQAQVATDGLWCARSSCREDFFEPPWRCIKTALQMLCRCSQFFVGGAGVCDLCDLLNLKKRKNAF